MKDSIEEDVSFAPISPFSPSTKSEDSDEDQAGPLDIAIDDDVIDSAKRVLDHFSEEHIQMYVKYLSGFKCIATQALIKAIGSISTKAQVLPRSSIKSRPGGQSPVKYQKKERKKKKESKCFFCDKVFDSFLKRSCHIDTHMDANGCFKCTLCNKVIRNKSGVRQHFERYHTFSEYSCHHCKSVFKSLSSLRYHVTTHSRIYSCSLCDRSFIKTNAFMEHLSTHSGVTPFKCPQCAKSYHFKESLTFHLKLHEGAPKFKCSFCDKRFVKKSMLDDHLRGHSDEKNYECDMCGKKFKFRQVLNCHKVSHSSVRNFACVTCNIAYKTKHALKEHQRRKHGPDFKVSLNELINNDIGSQDSVNVPVKSQEIEVATFPNIYVHVSSSDLNVNKEPVNLGKSLFDVSEVESDSED